MKTMGKDRVDVIDFMRGISIILMVIYHWFMMSNLKSGILSVNNPFLVIIGYIARVVFIFLVGTSLQLSKHKDVKNFLNKQLKRVFYIAVSALTITIVSRIVYPTIFVRFGILHYISVAILMLTFLSSTPDYVPLTVGILMFIGYLFIKNIQSNNFLLNIIGYYPNFNTIDYFPIFKWFWLSALGMFLASNYTMSSEKYTGLGKDIATLGKYSLEIYLLHFPIIYLIQSI